MRSREKHLLKKSIKIMFNKTFRIFFSEIDGYWAPAIFESKKESISLLGLKVDQCLDFLVGGSTNVVPPSNMDISQYIPNISGKREFK